MNYRVFPLALVAIASLVVLGSCDKRSFPVSKLNGGELVTPSGQFPAEQTQSFHVGADDGSVSIDFGLQPDESSIYIRHANQFGRSFRLKELSYELNGKRYPYEIADDPKYNVNGGAEEQVWVHPKPEGPLGNREFVSKNRGQVYEVKLEFTLADKPYTFNVDYEIGLKNSYEFGLFYWGP